MNNNKKMVLSLILLATTMLLLFVNPILAPEPVLFLSFVLIGLALYTILNSVLAYIDSNKSQYNSVVSGLVSIVCICMLGLQSSGQLGVIEIILLALVSIILAWYLRRQYRQ